jgi:hypothetical protein
MEYYSPDRPDDPTRRTEVPAGMCVTPDWRVAFKRALVGDNKNDIAEQYAVLYVIEAEDGQIESTFTSSEERKSRWVWCRLKEPLPVQKVIEINVDAWVLTAMQAKLGRTRNEALSRIVDDMSNTEPIVESDLDGVCTIRPATNPIESLTFRARQGAALHRLLFGREPPL